VAIDNLLSGLLGAVIGLVGAVVIAWNDRRQEVRAAARAVFMEVAANSAALVLAVKHGVYAPVVSSTWAGSHDRLSRGLSPADLVTVATFYMHVDAMSGAGFVAGQPDPRLAVVAGETLGRSVMAADILERRGWSTSEREALHDALKALAPKS
jgi:hypothetical protein